MREKSSKYYGAAAGSLRLNSLAFAEGEGRVAFSVSSTGPDKR